MAGEKDTEKKVDRFFITGEQISIMSAALGEMPAKISYQALKTLENLPKAND